MADLQAKLEQEEFADQSEQEKVIMNNTEEDNNIAEVGGQNDKIDKNAGGGGDINGDDMWELEDINVMETAAAEAEFLGGYGNNVSRGGWGEWKNDGGETWRQWEFYTAAANNNYEENDWVIDDLWIFDDHHYPNINGDAGGGGGANPRGPQA